MSSSLSIMWEPPISSFESWINFQTACKMQASHEKHTPSFDGKYWVHSNTAHAIYVGSPFLSFLVENACMCNANYITCKELNHAILPRVTWSNRSFNQCLIRCWDHNFLIKTHKASTSSLISFIHQGVWTSLKYHLGLRCVVESPDIHRGRFFQAIVNG